MRERGREREDCQVLEERERYLLSTISVNGSNIWVGSHNAIKKRDTLGIVRLVIELQVDNVFHKLPERLGAPAAQRFGGSCHFLLTH